MAAFPRSLARTDPEPAYRLNAARFGGVPNDPTRPADAVYAAMVAAGAARPAVQYYFPAGTWYFANPLVVERGNVEFRGEGAAYSTLAALSPGWAGGSPSSQPLILAARLTPGGLTETFTAAPHFPSAAGKLDGTAGARQGLRTGAVGTSIPSFQAAFWSGPASHIRTGWSEDPVLAWNLALEPLGGALAPGAVAGLTRPDGTQSPWRLGVYQPDVPSLALACVEPDGSTRNYEFYALAGSSAGKALRRVSFQADLEAGTVLAWADGVQVQVTTLSPMAPGVGRRLLANEAAPLLVGGQSNSIDIRGSAAAPDRAVYGLWVGRKALYANGGVGTPQARTDGRPITDLLSYFDDGSATGSLPLFYLTLQDDGTAADGVGGRRVRYMAGSDPTGPVPSGYYTYGWGMWVQALDQYPGPGPALGNLAVRDLALRGASWGQCVGLGLWFGDQTVERCGLDSACEGVANLPQSRANYVTTVRDCRFAAVGRLWAACLAFREATVRVVGDLIVYSAGRTVLRAAGCALVQSGSVWVGNQASWGDYLVRATAGYLGGNQLILRNWTLDNEVGDTLSRGPTKACFSWQCGGGMLGSRFDLRGITVGYVGAGCVLFDFRDNGTRAPRIECRDLGVDSTYPLAALVRTSGPVCSGLVERPASVNAGTPDRLHTDPNSTPNVQLVGFP